MKRSFSPSPRAGKISPIASALVVIIGAVIVIGAVLLLKGGSYSGLEPLPSAEYRRSPENFLGNQYRLTGQVHSLLLWEEGTGRLLAVIPEGDTGRLAVFVPDELQQSLHTGQRYHMQVAVKKGGLLYVEDLEKY
ncbi:hypothetical protein [Rubellicoccus peritrichatus]|uniref:Uncharacterized protein n=1 Tax=Rubellicoccus peritrichatus TaxID=3080537 RepID=A0AAQ3QWY3_9BACT|nr:hypothetical protein [Puniceicoccus sp. CR14]WOO42407.1 hypothetical protein RZN69_04845 [Puniceicoccus sp. CR14]